MEYFKEGENRPTMVEGGKQQLEHCVVVGVLGGFLPRIGGVYVVCGDNGEVLLPTKESASELLGKACQGRAHATRRVGDGNVDRLLLSSGIGGIHKKRGRWRRRRYDVGGQVCSLTWGGLIFYPGSTAFDVEHRFAANNSLVDFLWCWWGKLGSARDGARPPLPLRPTERLPRPPRPPRPELVPPEAAFQRTCWTFFRVAISVGFLVLMHDERV